MRRWLALLLLVLGVVLVGVGLFSLESLLSVSLEAQRPWLAKTLFPTLVGLWLFVGGIYTLIR